jgi:hypothetical protein
MSLADLIEAVAALAVGLVVVFAIWRRRRLRLRREAPDLEYFGD